MLYFPYFATAIILLFCIASSSSPAQAWPGCEPQFVAQIPESKSSDSIADPIANLVGAPSANDVDVSWETIKPRIKGDDGGSTHYEWKYAFFCFGNPQQRTNYSSILRAAIGLSASSPSCGNATQASQLFGSNSVLKTQHNITNVFCYDLPLAAVSIGIKPSVASSSGSSFSLTVGDSHNLMNDLDFFFGTSNTGTATAFPTSATQMMLTATNYMNTKDRSYSARTAVLLSLGAASPSDMTNALFARHNLSVTSVTWTVGTENNNNNNNHANPQCSSNDGNASLLPLSFILRCRVQYSDSRTCPQRLTDALLPLFPTMNTTTAALAVVKAFKSTLGPNGPVEFYTVNTTSVDVARAMWCNSMNTSDLSTAAYFRVSALMQRVGVIGVFPNPIPAPLQVTFHGDISTSVFDARAHTDLGFIAQFIPKSRFFVKDLRIMFLDEFSPACPPTRGTSEWAKQLSSSEMSAFVTSMSNSSVRHLIKYYNWLSANFSSVSYEFLPLTATMLVPPSSTAIPPPTTPTSQLRMIASLSYGFPADCFVQRFMNSSLMKQLVAAATTHNSSNDFVIRNESTTNTFVEFSMEGSDASKIYSALMQIGSAPSSSSSSNSIPASWAWHPTPYGKRATIPALVPAGVVELIVDYPVTLWFNTTNPFLNLPSSVPLPQRRLTFVDAATGATIEKPSDVSDGTNMAFSVVLGQCVSLKDGKLDSKSTTLTAALYDYIQQNARSSSDEYYTVAPIQFPAQRKNVFSTMQDESTIWMPFGPNEQFISSSNCSVSTSENLTWSIRVISQTFDKQGYISRGNVTVQATQYRTKQQQQGASTTIVVEDWSRRLFVYYGAYDVNSDRGMQAVDLDNDNCPVWFSSANDARTFNAFGATWCPVGSEVDSFGEKKWRYARITFRSATPQCDERYSSSQEYNCRDDSDYCNYNYGRSRCTTACSWYGRSNQSMCESTPFGSCRWNATSSACVPSCITYSSSMYPGSGSCSPVQGCANFFSDPADPTATVCGVKCELRDKTNCASFSTSSSTSGLCYWDDSTSKCFRLCNTSIGKSTCEKTTHCVYQQIDSYNGKCLARCSDFDSDATKCNLFSSSCMYVSGKCRLTCDNLNATTCATNPTCFQALGDASVCMAKCASLSASACRSNKMFCLFEPASQKCVQRCDRFVAYGNSYATCTLFPDDCQWTSSSGTCVYRCSDVFNFQNGSATPTCASSPASVSSMCSVIGGSCRTKCSYLNYSQCANEAKYSSYCVSHSTKFPSGGSYGWCTIACQYQRVSKYACETSSCRWVAAGENNSTAPECLPYCSHLKTKTDCAGVRPCAWQHDILTGKYTCAADCAQADTAALCKALKSSCEAVNDSTTGAFKACRDKPVTFPPGFTWPPGVTLPPGVTWPPNVPKPPGYPGSNSADGGGGSGSGGEIGGIIGGVIGGALVVVGGASWWYWRRRSASGYASDGGTVQHQGFQNETEIRSSYAAEMGKSGSAASTQQQPDYTAQTV